MIKFLVILYTFLRELVFDSKEEYNPRSHLFDLRKVSIYLLLVIFSSLTPYILYRCVVIAKENLEMQEKIKTMQVKIDECERSHGTKVK